MFYLIGRISPNKCVAITSLRPSLIHYVDTCPRNFRISCSNDVRRTCRVDDGNQQLGDNDTGNVK